MFRSCQGCSINSRPAWAAIENLHPNENIRTPCSVAPSLDHPPHTHTHTSKTHTQEAETCFSLMHLRLT